MRPEVIEDCEWTRKLKLNDGRVVQLVLNDALEWLQVNDEQGGKIGQINFHKIEMEDDYHYKIVWMYLDLKDASYKRKGIGRAALQFFKERADSYLVAEGNDGMRRDDGSHLTGDAPAFVAAMVKEGLIHSAGEFQRRESRGEDVNEL